MEEISAPTWRKSSRCEHSTCIEVAKVGDRYLIRDSKDLSTEPLTFTEEEWDAFVAGVSAGEFTF